MESWLDLESDGELEEHVEPKFGAENSQDPHDPHAASSFEDQEALSAVDKEMSEEHVASEPCQADGAARSEASGEARGEAREGNAEEEMSEDNVAPEPFQEAPVNDAENDKEMSEDILASEPLQEDHLAFSEEKMDEDSQLANARCNDSQLAAEELTAVEDVGSCEVQVVEEVDYEDAKSLATDAESEDEAASATSAAEAEDSEASEDSTSSSAKERRHKRRRRSSHHGHRRRRRRHHSSRDRDRHDTSRGRRKRLKTEKDNSGEANKQPVVPRAQREVYVGGLLWKDADKEGIAESFNSAFEALPDYQKHYGHETRKPVLQVHYPKDIIRKAAAGMRGDFAIFVFVEFIDQLLARTALKLTGLRIAQRSVRVCSTMGIGSEGETLDVEPLRQLEKLPLRPLDGTTMLLNVWLGGLPMRLCREELHRKRSGSWAKHETLESRICTAVLALPGIKLRYPQMERPIVSLRVSECQRYIFVEAATELIASSMVAAKGLSLPGGLEATTGWPVAVIDAEERAPPPLAEDGSLCDPSQVGALVQKAIVCEEDFAERLDCEIFMGGTNGLEVEDLWKALTELLKDLPSYKKQFPDLSLPLINIRMANGPYAFARLANPRLASTAVVIGEMFIRSRKVQLKRPTHCELSQKSAPPLDVIRPPLLPPPPPPRTPETRVRRGKGPEFPALPKAPAPPRDPCEAPPTPPKVPLNLRPRGTIQRIWIGNLPGLEKMLEMIDEEEEEKQENKGDAMEMMKRLVDRKVNELAMEMPNYDLEDGPLTKRVTVHPTGRYAFIRVVGDQEFVEELLDVLDGKAPAPPRDPCEAPPTPPKVPLNLRPRGTIQRIWIGNLPGLEKMFEMIDEEEEEKQENKGDAMEMMKRLVDRKVNELAMEMPNDLEDGPLTKRVTVHPTGRYAFIRVVGDQEFVEELLDVLDGKDFLGKPLRVNWAREKEDFWWQKKSRRSTPGIPRYVLQLPKGLQQLIAPEEAMEKLRTEEVVTNVEKVQEIDEL